MASASLKYSDSTDRAFGLSGMALALFVFDADKYIDTLSIDAPADAGLRLSADFFQPVNPAMSVKGVWTASFRQFQLTSAMVVGNLLARSMARRRSDLSHAVKSLLMSHLESEGMESCGLEPAEVNRVCDNAYNYLQRLLAHPTVNSAVCAMARELTDRHTLSRDALLPYLLPLSRL